jgi:hypothetical protein
VSALPWDITTVPPSQIVEDLENRARAGVPVAAEDLTRQNTVRPDAWKAQISQVDGVCVLMAPDRATFEKLTSGVALPGSSAKLGKGLFESAGFKGQLAAKSKPRTPTVAGAKSEADCKAEYIKQSMRDAVRSCILTRHDYGPNCEITNTICESCAEADLQVITEGRVTGQISATNPKRQFVFPDGYNGLSLKDGVCLLDPAALKPRKKKDVVDAVEVNAAALAKKEEEDRRLAACLSPAHVVTIELRADPTTKEEYRDIHSILPQFTLPGNRVADLLLPKQVELWLKNCDGGAASKIFLDKLLYKEAYTKYIT